VNVFTKLRILNLTLSKWGQIEKIVKGDKSMRLSVNSLIQILAMVGQYGNQVSDFLPAKGKFWAAVGIAAVQGIVGVLAHFKNPDGTSAAEAYYSPVTMK
jgi:hypothetical protein